MSIRQFEMTINGESISTAGSVEVINPCTGKVFARAPDAEREHLEAAVQAATSAQPDWAALSWLHRRDLLLQFADVLCEHEAELAQLLTLEQGKPLSSSHDEIQISVNYVRTLARIEIKDEIIRQTEGQQIYLRHRPLGVVAGITAWNYPVQLAASKLTMALITGNTTIIKPSPYTPLTTLRLGELGQNIFPPGVLNVVTGRDQLGVWMTSHPGISKIGFTGSGPTGKAIMRSGADSLKHLTLELGGNDAAIVLEDADPKSVAPKLFASAFENSGQLCNAIKRLYVHERIYDAVVAELVSIAKSKRVGDGLSPDTDLGPLQNLKQFERVVGFLEDIRETGGNIVAGGGVPDAPGYFIEPTIVAGVKEGSRIVDEEPFGPILPVLSFSNVDEAIDRANNSSFGLGGSVWTNNWQTGAELARRLQVGTTWINQHSALEPGVPSGGAKESGIGVEYSRLGLLEYTVPQVVNAIFEKP